MTVSEDPAVQIIADALHECGPSCPSDCFKRLYELERAEPIAERLRATGYPLNPDEVSVPRDEIDKLRRVARLQNDASLSTATCDFLARLDPSTKETR